MAEQEDPELPSPHTHTKTATVYRATLTENNLKTSRTAFLQQGYKERTTQSLVQGKKK